MIHGTIALRFIITVLAPGIDIIARTIQRGEQEVRPMVRGDEPVPRWHRRSPANWTVSVRYRTDDARSAS